MENRRAGLRRWRTRIGLAMLVVIALFLRAYSEPKQTVPTAPAWSFWGATVYPVIGDLGGAPVSIPSPYARLAEYEGDPAIGQAAVGDATPRTWTSKLRSVAFDLRFPDMKGLDDDLAGEEAETTVWTTNWMRVLLNAGSRYFGSDFLEANVESLADPEKRKYVYRLLPDLEFGLFAYAPVGVDESRRQLTNLGSADASDLNIYVHRDGRGHVATYIECSNVHHQAARCAQEFDLSPDMEAAVSISYRKDLLVHWRAIQDSVRHTVLGFRADPPSN
ncbi:hypothetical protein [Variovorax sp. Sphag1AA]|uniref:hypothetical protein n=1 Tax=Variovorax sp. Sphag1AA TaxID=2587027 RepID=UPI001612FD0B|nr:hypothetical protein [Variovorax sp. Sphag1AA]MBB3180691.1 hypothetical protein [Variovorax sp. Sphag1AA]